MRTRKTDPQSSHDAVKRVSVVSQQGQVLRILKLIGRRKSGYTAEQLRVSDYNYDFYEDRYFLDRYQISRRLPELAELGKVERVGVGICPIKKVKMMFWRRA